MKQFKYRDSKTAYLMIAPAVLLLFVFSTIPLIMAVVRSFQDYQTKEFVLFENYDFVLKTPTFVKSFSNILFFVVIIVSMMMLLTFLFAHVLQGMRSKAASVVKVVTYIPCLLSGVIISIIYIFILNYGGGLMTSILVSLGKTPISFQIEGIWPYLCVVIPTIWGGFGYNSLVMYAGLMNIPRQYYEAAQIDGANALQRTFYITIPCMRNYFLLMLVNLITGNLQMLEIPYLITGGGPQEKTMTPALYLYNSFRDANRSQNVTIAGALLIMILIVVINVVAFKSIGSTKAEDA